MRRSGVIFIRRDTKADPVYRFVLREYIGYLVEKRFALEWFIEGGRSRTGKLLPPRFGLLTYVVDAYREGRTDDVVLVPASITYDHLREVSEYAGEARGAEKKREDFRWYVRYMRSLRGRYGKIYVRFGEPVSLRDTLGPATGHLDVPQDEHDSVLQKLAFEVCWRINRVTPITATSLITLTLLTAGQGLTFEQLRVALAEYLAFFDRRALPTTDSTQRLASPAGVRTALDALTRQKVVEGLDGGPELVYFVPPDQYLAAAFYRNSIAHFFLDPAITELALVRASEPDVSDRVEEFWRAALELRDLLKFDFFFLEREEFRLAIGCHLSEIDAEWQQKLAAGPEQLMGLLRRSHPLSAHTTLRSFCEAYYIVGRTLTWLGDDIPNERALLGRCEALGRQYLAQQRIRCPEAVSRLLFKTGLQLAANRGLVSGADAATARAEFVRSLRDLLRRMDTVEQIAREEFGALLGLRD